MKVGLFAHASEDLPAEPLLRSLSENGIDASVYRVRESWGTIDTAEIERSLSGLSHIVVWADRRMPPAGWCALLAGFALGRRTGMYVLTPRDGEVDSYLRGFQRIRDPQALADTLIGSRSGYEDARRSEEARDELIASGFALTERTFLEAVSQGDERATRNFLVLGYSPDTRDESGLPALFLAVQSGNPKLVQLLVDYGAEANIQSGGRGTSPLMEAAGTGQVAITRLLLEAGADPDMTSSYGQSAAILAASEGHAETLRLLLQWNARTDLVDHLGMTALKYAELFRHEAAVRVLKELG